MRKLLFAAFATALVGGSACTVSDVSQTSQPAASAQATDLAVATAPTATATVQPLPTVDPTAIEETDAVRPDDADRRLDLEPVATWGGTVLLRSSSVESCPATPELWIAHSGPNAYPYGPVAGLSGHVVDADFLQEQSVGYVVTECDDRLFLHVMALGFSGDILRLGNGLGTAIGRSEADTIGWESYRSIRVGNRVLDLDSRSFTALSADDRSTRTLGMTAQANFRYVVDGTDSGCDATPLIVENRQTGERLPALPPEQNLPIVELKTNGVGGLAVWTTRCDQATRLHSASVDPTTGVLTEQQQHLAVDNDSIWFTLHVHGELKAWTSSQIATGDMTPTIRIDLAEDLP